MEHFKYENPDLNIKTVEDQPIAKFGHLNTIVDNINTLEKTTAALRETIFGTPDEILYTEVSISSDQILDIGNRPVVILPQLSVSGSYYDISKIILEGLDGEGYTPNDTDDFFWIGGAGSYMPLINIPTLLSSSGRVTILKSGSPTVLTNDGFSDYPTVEGVESVTGVPVTLNSWNGVSPIGGDFDLLVKIWYTVRTIGSELSFSEKTAQSEDIRFQTIKR